MSSRDTKLEAFGRLLDVMDELREKCPWDRKHTNESLRANTIEETYELAEAIINNDNEEIKKELGDLLLHIVFYSKIGEEKGVFDKETAKLFRDNILSKGNSDDPMTLYRKFRGADPNPKYLLQNRGFID